MGSPCPGNLLFPWGRRSCHICYTGDSCCSARAASPSASVMVSDSPGDHCICLCWRCDDVTHSRVPPARADYSLSGARARPSPRACTRGRGVACQRGWAGRVDRAHSTIKGVKRAGRGRRTRPLLIVSFCKSVSSKRVEGKFLPLFRISG